MARFFPLCALALVAFVMVQLSNQAAVEKEDDLDPLHIEPINTWARINGFTSLPKEGVIRDFYVY